MQHSANAVVSHAPLSRAPRPARYRPAGEWVVPTVRDLRVMRTGLRDQLLDPALRDLAADDVVLVASELATNALLHGDGPAVLQLLVDGRACLLDVADHDVSTTPYVAGSRPPGAGGFGLAITGQVASSAGWFVAEQAKHVWAEFVPAGPATDDGSVRMLREVADQVAVDQAVGILRAEDPGRDELTARGALRARSRQNARSVPDEARALIAALTA